MASQIANSMSDEDKNSIENMDMEKMLSHVTKNVFKMMNGMGGMGGSGGMGGMEEMINGMAGMGVNNKNNNNNNNNSNNTNSESLILLDSSVESDNDSEENTIYPKTRDICFDLNVDLEDFYTGKKKKLNVKRKRIVEIDGVQTVVEEKKKLIIPIEKGMKGEQKIRFEGEADQIPGYKPGDIIINLIENEHSEYQRDGDNLIIIKNINLYQIYDLTFEITHLDSRVIRITKDPNDALHLNNSLRKIPGEGMPSFKSNGVHGDLFIRFNIVIPKSLDQNKLNIFKNVFEDSIDLLSSAVAKNYILVNVSKEELEEIENSSESETSNTSSDTDSETDSDTDSESDNSEESIQDKPVLVNKKSFKMKL